MPGDDDTARVRPRWVSIIQPLFCHGRRTMTFFLALTAAALVLAALHPFDLVRGATRTTLLWLIAILFLLACLRSLLSILGRVIEPPSHDRGSDLDDQRADKTQLIAAARTAILSQIGADEIAHLVRTYTSPGDVVPRIAETIDLTSTHSYTSSSVRTVLVSAPINTEESDGRRRLCVPVLRAPKSQLVDQLSVSSEGKTVRTLSHLESRGAAILVAEVLVKNSFHDAERPPDLLATVCEILVDSKPAPKNGRKDLLNAVATAFETFPANSLAMRQARAALIRLTELSLDTYEIIAVIDGIQVFDRFIKVNTVYSEARQRIRRSNMAFRINDAVYFWIRTALGLIPRSHSLRLSLATECQSYHLRCTVPNSLYVYELDLKKIELREKAPSSYRYTVPQSRSLDPALRASKTEGQNYIHAYARDLDVMTRKQLARGDSATIPILSVELRERPPGLMFIVFLMCGYLALLSLGVAFFHSRVFGLDFTTVDPQCLTLLRNSFLASDPAHTCKVVPNPPTSWPAVLFGLPALVSGWLISRFTAEAVSSTSISTIAVTIWGTVNAAAAIGLAALEMNIDTTHPMSVLGLTVLQPLWLVLTLSCVASLAMTMLLLCFRVFRYGRRVA